MKQRYVFIDVLKCIAILFVVMLHVRVDNYQWLINEEPLCIFRYCFRSILAVCVPMFFFCNGFLLLNKTFELKKHIYKIIKILVLTIVWGGVFNSIYDKN